MNSDNIVAITLPFMFSWIVWMVFSTILRYKIAKLQADVQTKLLDKVGSGQDLLATPRPTRVEIRLGRCRHDRPNLLL